MKISCIDQSAQDGDLYLLQIANKNILYGSILKISTILRYLPAHFEFPDDEQENNANLSDQQHFKQSSGGMSSPKSQKRQKVIEKEDQFAQLLKPLNIQDCDFESVPDPDLEPLKPFSKLKISKSSQNSSKLYRKIDGEYFIDNDQIKFDLRSLNILNVSDIDIILVSNFNDLYGLPFITRLQEQKKFKGKVFMTVPVGQIGQHLLNELVILNDQRNQTKQKGQGDSGSDFGGSYFKQEKMKGIFAKLGIEEWQNLYTQADIDECFEQHVTLLNYNESYTFDNLIKITPLSSGMHIGSCNWILNVGQQKIGLLSNSSEEGDFRYPLYFNAEALQDLDLLLVGSVVKQNAEQSNFWQQSKSFYEKLNMCLSQSPNSKVILPVQSPFILEIVDLLIHKITHARIIFISESANQLIQYSNINVEYLNQKLQTKILSSENPFSFDKLFKEERLFVFKNIKEYLEYKKEKAMGMAVIDEFCQELIITTSPNLRIGEAVYWLHHLNKYQPSQNFMILTDPQYCNNDLLMKPFAKVNNIRVLHSPIDLNLSFQQLNNLVNRLKPKRVICPRDYMRQGNNPTTYQMNQKNSGNMSSSMDQPSNKNCLIIEDEDIVVETLIKGATLHLSENEFGELKYKGQCSAYYANHIKQKAKGQTYITRIACLDMDFKDNKYTVTNISNLKETTDQRKALSFYSKILEATHHKNTKDEKIKIFNTLVKLNQFVPLSNSVVQIKAALNQNGFKCTSKPLKINNDQNASDDESYEQIDGYLIQLEEVDIAIKVDYKERNIQIEYDHNLKEGNRKVKSSSNSSSLATVSRVQDIIKKVFKLI
eukprot:403356179